MTDTVYLVAWLGTGVVKAGYTGRTRSKARYRAHELRGATTLLRATFPTIGDAFAAEDALSSIVQDAATGPAFTDRDDARRSGLVADGGGWMECFSVPDELLGDVVARSEQCIRAMHASIAQASASTRSTNGRTNALTLEALPLASRYGALVTRTKGSSE